jgi:hypothetical protein
MKFWEMIKVGDLVIKNTGGNKMKVVSISDNKAECAWISDSFHQDLFVIDELLPYSEYPNLFKDEKRNDMINSLLSN